MRPRSHSLRREAIERLLELTVESLGLGGRVADGRHEAQEPLLVGGKDRDQLIRDAMLIEWTTTTVRSTSPIDRSVTEGHRVRSRVWSRANSSLDTCGT